MSFLYEIGINEFIQNVADLLHAPNSMDSTKRIVGGYLYENSWRHSVFDG